MGKRETYTAPLKCTCENEGIAILEENENPIYGGGLNTKLMSISGEFVASGNEILCKQCGRPVKK